MSHLLKNKEISDKHWKIEEISCCLFSSVLKKVDTIKVEYIFFDLNF